MGTMITENNITNDHRKAFDIIAKEIIVISDIVLEILDARFIEQTRIPVLEKMITDAGKKIIFILNKSDLVDTKIMVGEGKLNNVKPYVFVSSKLRRGKLQLLRRIKMEIAKANIKFPRAHVGVIGYPNTGKSTLINYLAGRRSAPTSSEANYTKGAQKIRLTKDILLLDTPGVVPPVEDNLLGRSIVKKAEIGAERYSQTKDPELVVASLMKKHGNAMEKFYGIDYEADYEEFGEKLGRKFNLLLKGNKVDLDKTYRRIIKDWQDGKIH
ncbi:MAG: 50S ribosome-binding GTPase [Nanoarchaeota archaeon]|nr:50S ribosome-binding GTPase [Nanoarchaeota archaeon]